MSKRELAARWSARTGITALLEALPHRSSLMVLTYHRIGNPEDTIYDPDTFSATADELDRQIAYLKREFQFITLEEASAFAAGKMKPRRTCLLITFDDGYLDNYTIAFPVLCSHGVQGVFFLPTYFVGTNHLPWWDMIAYIVRRSERRRIHVTYPQEAVFDRDCAGEFGALRSLLTLFKQPATQDQERFVAELEEACDSRRPGVSAERCFLDWREAQEMQNRGMAFGSHTHSHQILSKLTEQQQYEELVQSRAILESHLSGPIDTLAYPVGRSHAFSSVTLSAARRAGYRAAFSHYGGNNQAGATDPLNICRHPMDNWSIPYLRMRTALGAVTGTCWI